MKTIIKAYHKNSNIVAYHKYEDKFILTGVVICEETFDKNGNTLTYKNSNGFYHVKGKLVSKEEYESFINQLNSKNLDVIEAEIEGRKYKLKLIK